MTKLRVANFEGRIGRGWPTNGRECARPRAQQRGKVQDASSLRERWNSRTLLGPVTGALPAPWIWALILLGSAPLIESIAHAAALSPEEERASFRLDDTSLIVELVAAEPDVISPVAITWDANGRMFAAEMIDYPAGPTTGRVRLLEDGDGDGRYEKAMVFADTLPFPNGVLAWNGGVLVTAAPDILFLKDTDGDGRADERRVVLTGFAEGNQQLRVNGLLWGLDGWVYGANGRSDGEIHRPGDAKKISLRGHDFRFRPETGQFEAVAGRSQFGLARDDWGNRFLSWNTIPIRHEVIPERHLSRNPRINLTEAVADLLDDKGEVFPMTPAPQTFNKESTSHFNALAGLTIYRGDALPASYRGNAFVGETLRNLVHRRVLEPNGATFIAKRVEQGREFLASTDPWFHPVNFATGPDGALYVVDFYREWVEHPGFVPEKLRGQVAWRAGAEHGRIWRVRGKANATRRASAGSNAAPGTLSAPELVGLLRDENGWRRDVTQRLLAERRDLSVVPLLKHLALRGTRPVTRVQSLFTLDRLESLDDPTLTAALDDVHPRVREAGLQLVETRLRASPLLLQRNVALAADPSARVRLWAALNLAEADREVQTATLAKLTMRADLDRFTALAIRSSAAGRAWPLLERIWRGAPSNPPVACLELMRDLAGDVAAGTNGPDRQAFLGALVDARLRPVGELHTAAFAGFAEAASTGGPDANQQLRDWSAATNHSAFFSDLVGFAHNLARGNSTAPSLAAAAFSTLAHANTAEGRSALLAMLLPPHRDEVQSGAVAAIIRSGDASLLQRAFSSWNRYQVSIRRQLLAGSVRSSAAVAVLVDALENGRVAVTELDASVRQSLLGTKSPELKTRIQKLLGPEVSPDRQAMVEKFTPALQLAGDAARGAGSFARLCLQCHAVQALGHRVGPDLSGIAARPGEALLSDILDPSREVAADFASYNIKTSTGDTLTGLLVSENPAGLTLRRAGIADEIIPRPLIKQVEASGRSLMPEGLEAGVTLQDFADLLAFLRAPEPALLPK
jgi:putative membrane-bound dehydrogenase-like protein